MDRLCTERHPGVWHNGGLENDGVKRLRCGLIRSRRVGFMAAWRKEEVGAARHRQEKREATGLGKLLARTEAYNFSKGHPLA